MRRVVVLFLLCFASLPVRAADSPMKFVVFFQEWSANLDDPAQGVIGHAADAAKAHKGRVRVDAFASPTGSRKANELLSDLRAQLVMDQLQADGVALARTIGRGHGPVHYALSAQESRRVEIIIGDR
jgi:outer membrane protein OmpA-like peptidoglycan-associated protein